MRCSLLAYLLVFSCASLAQSASAAQELKPLTQEFGFWSGFSPTSTIQIAATKDRRLFTLNAKYSIVLLTSQHTALRWVSEAVPLAVLHQPAEAYWEPRREDVVTQPAGYKYAYGLTPLGLQFNLFRHRRVQPYTDIHGGFLYFNQNVPVPNARRFNFTFNFGGGIELFNSERSAISFGFKYHHLSNNETAFANPGVDSPMFYVGYSWYKRH